MKRLFLISLVALLGFAFVIPMSSSWSAGTLKVTTPNGGQKWETGKKYAIKWVKGNAGGTVKIQLLKSGKHHKWIAKKTKNDGRYTWKIPTTVDSGSAYKVKIVSVKNKKVFDKSNKNFTISKTGGDSDGDNTSTLKVTTPNGGETWKPGTKYAIKWDKGNAGKFVRLFLLKSTGKRYKTISKKTKNDGKHPWKVPATITTGSAYKIRVQAVTDTTVRDDSDSNFTIGESFPSGDYQYLYDHNAYRYGGLTSRWPSTVSVSGATGDWRNAVNRWPKPSFNFVGSGGGINIEWGDSTEWCGVAYTYTNSSKEIYRCDVKINRNLEWRVGWRRAVCKDYSFTVTHEIGHCIGFRNHTSDGGLMDPSAVGSNQLTSPVRNMINLLYSLSPGTDISSKLSLPVRKRARLASGKDSRGSIVIVHIDYPSYR